MIRNFLAIAETFLFCEEVIKVDDDDSKVLEVVRMKKPMPSNSKRVDPDEEHEDILVQNASDYGQEVEIDELKKEFFQYTDRKQEYHLLPMANISRIMIQATPIHGKIAKGSRESIQECVSEFISFITSEAAENCQASKRKKITAEDILLAMSNLGFDNYIEPLKLYLQKYREGMKIDNISTASELQNVSETP